MTARTPASSPTAVSASTPPGEHRPSWFRDFCLGGLVAAWSGVLSGVSRRLGLRSWPPLAGPPSVPKADQVAEPVPPVCSWRRELITVLGDGLAAFLHNLVREGAKGHPVVVIPVGDQEGPRFPVADQVAEPVKPVCPGRREPVLIRVSSDGLAVLVCDVVGEVPECYPLVKTAPGHRDCVRPLAPKVGLACTEGIQGRLLVDQLAAASAAAATCAKLPGRGRKPRPGAPGVADITR